VTRGLGTTTGSAAGNWSGEADAETMNPANRMHKNTLELYILAKGKNIRVH
jgi:hypothetical protein